MAYAGSTVKFLPAVTDNVPPTEALSLAARPPVADSVICPLPMVKSLVLPRLVIEMVPQLQLPHVALATKFSADPPDTTSGAPRKLSCPVPVTL